MQSDQWSIGEKVHSTAVGLFPAFDGEIVSKAEGCCSVRDSDGNEHLRAYNELSKIFKLRKLA